MKVEMGSRRCEIHLPTDWTVRAIRPGAFALAMMAIVHPFCGPEIRLRLGVSRTFHNQVKTATKIEILPINEELTPRKDPTSAVPASSSRAGIYSYLAVLL